MRNVLTCHNTDVCFATNCIQRDERLALFHAAVEKHQTLYRDAMSGKGTIDARDRKPDESII